MPQILKLDKKDQLIKNKENIENMKHSKSLLSVFLFALGLLVFVQSTSFNPLLSIPTIKEWIEYCNNGANIWVFFPITFLSGVYLMNKGQKMPC